MTRTPRTKKKRGLAFKLSVFILTSTTLIFMAAFGYNYYFSRQLVLKNVREAAMNLTQAAVLKIEIILRSVEKPPRLMALHLENKTVTHDGLLAQLKDMVVGSPEIFGSAVAFAPYQFDAAAQAYAPYFYRGKAGAVVYAQLGNNTYNYFLRDWYLIPKELDRPVWSEPYYDEDGGDILMATYSYPFHHLSPDPHQFQGVVTADISLEALVTAINAISLYQSGYAFLLSRNGVFVAHPDKTRIMHTSVFSLAEEMGSPDLRRIGREMIHGGKGVAEYTSVYTGKPSLLSYAPVPSSGWSVGVVVPKAELLADIYALNHRVLIIGAVGFTLLFLVVVAISRSITRPLHSLVRMTGEIATGNLDVELPAVRSGDEVGVLTQSVDQMRVALKEYINDLTETTKARERIESELKIARTIQMSFLPKRFPQLQDHQSFDIFAELESAKHVGGDLYDFFMLNDDQLFFSVGDVSDKGVPAALFMAVTKTLMKGIAEQGLTPAQILTRVNAELCQGNESSMFVTIACGILNLSTGVFEYSNAGHNPPVLLRAGGAPEWLSLPPGLVLGAMEEALYATRELKLNPGDKLLLYTDGVTEAMDAAHNLFSDERLLKEMETIGAAEPRQMIEQLLAAVQAHADGAAQSDDITVLALHYKGNG